ncbi:MAG: KH domain-containing protein [Chloroflexi bacterium]|nr:KH domain-containing protein [Chloroflexota bacterium]
MEGESLEVSARTVADAIKRAVEMTGRPEGDLQVTVLSEGRGGILGIGGEDAHILVAVRTQPIAEISVATTAPPRAASRLEADHAPITEEVAEEARAVLLDLLDLLGLDTDVAVRRPNGTVTLEVQGEDLGLLIGRRGDTLAALQFLLNLIMAKRQKRWLRVNVDVEGYRARREATLSSLARRIAQRVHESGQPVALEAMPAAERRIIHVALAENPHVSTGSVGEGENRKVVITPRA